MLLNLVNISQSHQLSIHFKSGEMDHFAHESVKCRNIQSINIANTLDIDISEVITEVILKSIV